MSLLQGIFNTAVQGMNAQSHALSTISTNVANVQTTGYKTETTHFETLLNDIQSNGQKFYTAKTMDSRNVSAQGQVLTTNRTMDLALNGRGFLIANTQNNGNGIWEYTRDGALFGKATDDGTGINLTTSNGDYVYGWPANDDGTFAQTASLGALKPVTILNNSTIAAKQTTAISIQANLSNAYEGRQAVTVPFIDATGVSRTTTLGFTGTVGSGWNLDVTASDGSPASIDSPSPANITFDGNGKLVTPADGKLTITVNDPTGNQTMTVDLSKMTSYADDGNITVQDINQDGYIEGRLNNTYFNSEGVLIGSYSNGETKNLFKLPVATFAVDDKLEARQGNYFVQTAEAGDLTIRGLGTEGTTTGGTSFVTGALEQSTVDLADQFSRMIVTQRAYSSNATVIRTADEMTQAVRDLKR